MPRPILSDLWARGWRILLATCLTPGICAFILFVSAMLDPAGAGRGRDAAPPPVFDVLADLLVMGGITALTHLPAAAAYALVLGLRPPRPRERFVQYLFGAAVYSLFIIIAEIVFWPVANGLQTLYDADVFIPSQLFGLLAGAIVGYQYGRADRDILAKAGRDE